MVRKIYYLLYFKLIWNVNMKIKELSIYLTRIDKLFWIMIFICWWREFSTKLFWLLSFVK